MRIHKLTIAALAIGAIAAGGAAAMTSASGASGTTSLTLTAAPSSGTPIDLGRQGTSIGDQFLESGSLRASSGRAGYFQLASQLVSGNSRHGTEASSIMLHLRGGEIVATGGHALSERYALAVVGGTGRYAGAGGTLRISPGKHETTRLTVVLQG